MKCVLILSLIFTYAHGSHASDGRSSRQKSKCARSLMNQTDSFLVYLGALTEERLIGEKELSRMLAGLKQEQKINPISTTQRQIVVELHEAHDVVEEYLSDENLEIPRILLWTERKIAELQKNRSGRQEARQDTSDLFEKMIFFPIKTRAFLKGRSHESVPVNLTRDFEMMSTKVTQNMWIKIMGENPSHHLGDLDYPVENMTFWSVLVFINRLSEARGLQPAYDLSGISWKPGTRAENGTLEPDGDKVKAALAANKTLNRKNPRVHDTSGYRLPTDSEAEYVRQMMSEKPDQKVYLENDSLFHRYSWYRFSSDLKHQPVAAKPPLYVQGNPYYDLLGLVWEWCWDIHQSDLITGVDPQGAQEGIMRVVRGGSIESTSFELGIHNRTAQTTLVGGKYIGFRVVRTLPKK